MKTKKVVARSGRFTQGPSDVVARYTESVSFDWRLWRQDIEGSRAHARMLARQGMLGRGELRDILKGLDEIAAEIAAGKFRWDEVLEDVHMNIEAALTRRVPAGAKLHTGRSRNDQVAVDLRLWLRDEIGSLRGAVRGLQKSLVELGERHREVILPGYTHLQRAQPVYVAHHLLAYVEMLERDQSRLADAGRRVNVCPLGSGALAGTTLPLDRAFVARSLGFRDEGGRPAMTRNSMDAVSDRDFVIEFCSAAALLAVHLSRLAEDIVLWSSAEFGFLRLEDAYTTGSSLMPQKKNPDVAELARGKCGRVVGNLTALLCLLKGLPMTYNRDLQEDKERLFDTADTVRETVTVLAEMLRHAAFRGEACGLAAKDPQLLATDLADYLVLRGLPFRRAHHVVGELVARAEAAGVSLSQLSLEDYRSVHPLFARDVREVFDLKKAMGRRRLLGAPGTREMGRQLDFWKKNLRKVLV